MVFGSILCFSRVSDSDEIQTLPVLMSIWTNGTLPFFLVIPSAHIPLWSTHRTSPPWASKDRRIIWISIAVRRSAVQPAVSLWRWSYNDLASQMVKSLDSSFVGSTVRAATNSPLWLVRVDHLLMSKYGSVISPKIPRTHSASANASDIDCVSADNVLGQCRGNVCDL